MIWIYFNCFTYLVRIVEAVDPIVLGAKLIDCCDCRCCDCDLCEIPTCVCQCFSCDLTPGDDYRRVFVTLGQFSIIRLERDSQLLMPVYDYCLPDKSCNCGSGCSCDDPCEMFQNISFPVDQFFPPKPPCDNPCDSGPNQPCRKSPPLPQPFPFPALPAKRPDRIWFPVRPFFVIIPLPLPG